MFKLFLKVNMEKSSFCILVQFYAELLCMCFNFFDYAEVYWRKEMEWAFARGWEGVKRT